MNMNLKFYLVLTGTICTVLFIYLFHFKPIKDLTKETEKQKMEIKVKNDIIHIKEDIIIKDKFEQNITDLLLKIKEELNDEVKTQELNDSIGTHILTI